MSTSTSQAPATRRHQEVETVSNGQDNAGFVTIEIAGQEIALPVKFSPGHVLTETQAKILDAAYQRQFTNNENAMAKARYAKENGNNDGFIPLTATAYAEKYATYEPNVGGARMGSMEKIRNDAAWRMWTALVAEHNASVTRQGPPVIARAGNRQVPGLKPIRGTDGKVVAGGTVAEQRDRMVARLLTMPEFADRIQLQVDAIIAERKGGVDTAADDTVSVDSLFD